MIWSALLSVLAPHYCLHCGKILTEAEPYLCLHCRSALTASSLELLPKNILEQRLFAQADLFCATALFYYQKGSVAQDLIHALKYKGAQPIGDWLGKWLAEMAKGDPSFAKAEVVLPVPLHPSKLRLRGYNQVARFGEAIAKVLGIPYYDDVLVKITANTTQTRKHIWRRLKDSNHIFALQNTDKIAGKHVLLVDDLITTGATLDNCYQVLCQVPNTPIGVAAIAYSILG